MALNNLSSRLSALGRREEALAAIEEGVDLYRALAEVRPDIFSEEFSISLGTLSDIRNATNDRSGAYKAIGEAIRVLRPLFIAQPQAVRHWMAMHLQRYIALGQGLGRQPDFQLIGPVIEVFQRLQGEDDDE